MILECAHELHLYFVSALFHLQCVSFSLASIYQKPFSLSFFLHFHFQLLLLSLFLSSSLSPCCVSFDPFPVHVLILLTVSVITVFLVQVFTPSITKIEYYFPHSFPLIFPFSHFSLPKVPFSSSSSFFYSFLGCSFWSNCNGLTTPGILLLPSGASHIFSSRNLCPSVLILPLFPGTNLLLKDYMFGYLLLHSLFSLLHVDERGFVFPDLFLIQPGRTTGRNSLPPHM